MIIRASKLALRLVAGLLAALIVLFSAMAWRLSGGPISLGFLTPYVGEALSDRQAGFTAEIKTAILSWSGTDRTLGIGATDVRLMRQDGSLVAAVPMLQFRLSLKALLRGRLAPTSIDIVGVRLNVRREMDGRIDAGLAGGAAAGNILGLLVSELATPSGHGVAGYLTHASIRDAAVTLDDKRLGVVWQAPEAGFDLAREPGGVRGRMRLAVTLGGKLAHLVATGDFDRASHATRATVLVSDLVPSSLAVVAPVLAPLAGVNVPISGRVNLTADSEGRIGTVDFDLDGGAGEIIVPKVALAALAVRSLALVGSARNDFADIALSRVALELPDFMLSASGDIHLGAEGTALTLSATVPRLAVPVLDRYWPADVAIDARDWIVGNITDGTLKDIALRLDLPAGALTGAVPLPDGAITLNFAYDGLKVSYLRTLPPLTQGAGQAVITQSRLDMTGITAASGDLRVRDGHVVITGLDEKDQTATITFQTAGPLASALALLDRPPLHFISPMGVSPQSAGGSATIDARFVMPLKKKLSFADMQVAASASLQDAALPKIADRFPLSRGDLAVQVDKKHLEIKGTADLAGVPLHVLWQENFTGAGPFDSRYTLKGTIDDAGRKALGFDTRPYISGPVAASLEIDSRRRGATRIDGTLGLAKARLEIPQAYWHKPAGGAGEASFHVTLPRAGETDLTGFTIAAGDLRASGSGSFGPQGLERFALPKLIFGHNDLTLEIGRRGDGGYRILVSGKRFDLAPFLADTAATTAATTVTADQGPTLELSGHLDALRFGPGRAVADVAARILRQDGRIAQMTLNGRLGQKAKLQVAITPAGRQRHLAVVADDAGAVVKLVGISDNLVGGSFALNATMADDQPGAPISGRIVMHDFKVIKAPVLARLLTVASLSGMGEILSGQGIAFTNTEIPFTMEGSKITIRDALGHGGALGFTLDGSIDRAAGKANLGGTLVPAYTLNTLLGKLPLIGQIFTSRPGEGIFGITYRVTGPIDNPQVSVNPLSALTPGILRRIFEIGEGGQAVPGAAMKSGPPQGTNVPQAAPPAVKPATPLPPAPAAPPAATKP